MSVFLPKTTKTQIVERYFNVINEYFDKANDTTFIKSSEDVNNHLLVGIHSIHRVFEYVLLKTKNPEKAYYTSQQSYYYYLEYIEQIHTSPHLSSSMDTSDVVQFVYKKTLCDLFDGVEGEQSNTLSNMMTLDDESISIKNAEWKAFFPRILRLMNVLFYWNNENITFSQRHLLCSDYLKRLFQCIEKMDVALLYIEYIQRELTINFTDYKTLVEEFIKKSEKITRVRSGSISNDEKNDWYLTKLCLQKEKLIEFIKGSQMKEMVSWLLSDV